jgi:hypothetical protein
MLEIEVSEAATAFSRICVKTSDNEEPAARATSAMLMARLRLVVTASRLVACEQSDFGAFRIICL